jgi:F-box/leucine-rich repeat protein 2/20
VPSWDLALTGLVQSAKLLTKLTLTNLPVFKSGLCQALLKCAGLADLRLRFSNLTLPTEIALPSLVSLDITGCYFTDDVLLAIGQNCPRLQLLHLFGGHFSNRTVPPVTDAGMRAVLQGCPLLRDTDVQWAGVFSREVRAAMASRHRYRTLKLSNWEGIENELAQHILKVCPDLVELRCGPWRVKDATLVVCSVHCPLLKILVLYDCVELTGSGLHQLCKPGNTLQTIELSHNSQAGGEIVLAIAQHCPLLETCGIHCFHSLTDAAIVELAQGCPLLSALTLLEVGVTGVAIAALAKQCDRPEFLQIRSCERVTTDVVCVLAEYCKKLKRLTLCRSFTGQDFSKLVNAGTTVHCT